MEIVPRERRIEALLEQRFEWTARQREVLDLLARGRSNQEVAEALGISLDGAKWHMREILGKLGVDTREEAGEYWRRYNGWRERGRRAAARVWAPALVNWVIAPAAVAALAGVVLAATWLAAGDDSSDGGPPAAASPEPEGLAQLLALQPHDISEFEHMPAGPLSNADKILTPDEQPEFDRVRDMLLAALKRENYLPGAEVDNALLHGFVVRGTHEIHLSPAWACVSTPNSISCDAIHALAVLTLGSETFVFRSLELGSWLHSGYSADFAREPQADPLTDLRGTVVGMTDKEMVVENAAGQHRVRVLDGVRHSRALGAPRYLMEHGGGRGPVSVGDVIRVRGTLIADGSIHAETLCIRCMPYQKALVVSSDGNQLDVRLADDTGAYSEEVTRVYGDTATPGNLELVKPGDEIIFQAAVADDGTIVIFYL